MAQVIDRDAVKAMIDQMPEGTTMDQLIEALQLRAELERRYQRYKDGERTYSSEEVWKSFGLED